MNWFGTPPRLLAVLALGSALAAPRVLAQPATPPGPAAPDNIVFFADGANLDLRQFGGNGSSIIDTTSYNGQQSKVLRYKYAAGRTYPLVFNNNPGVDISANVASGDVIHFWINGSASLQNSKTRLNGTYSGVQIRLRDSFETTGEPDLSNPSAKNLGFRLTFAVPNSLLDGTWKEVTLPFPPATRAALDAARPGYVASGDLRQYLYYEGAEVFNLQGVGPAYNAADPNAGFVEFDFENVTGLAVGFDYEGGAGNLYLDDVYIGARNLNLDFARARPAAITGVSASTNGNAAVFTIPANPDYRRYRIYASESPITITTVDGIDDFGATPVYPIATRRTTGNEAITVSQKLYKAFPTDPNTTLYFAAVGESQYGVSNNTVTESNKAAASPVNARQGYIFQMDGTNADAILDAVDAGTVTIDPWTAATSAMGFADPTFTLNNQRFTPVEFQGDRPTDINANVSVPRMYAAYDNLGFLYIYAEITDDQVTTADTSFANNLFQFDSFEAYVGLYTVPYAYFGQANQSIFRGMGRGAEPDYQIKFSPRVDAAGNPAGMYIDALTMEGFFFQNIRGAQLPDARGAWERTPTGWRFMAYLEVANLVSFPTNTPDTPDPNFLPQATERRTMPFNFAVNDNDNTDGTRNRSVQVNWSVKHSLDGNVYRQGSEWVPTAIVGRSVSVADEAAPGAALEFGLTGIAPNPARSGSQIAFSLATAADVTIDVYDALGRRVATPVAGVAYQAGANAARVDLSGLAPGIYVVRVRAGAEMATGKLTVVR